MPLLQKRKSQSSDSSSTNSNTGRDTLTSPTLSLPKMIKAHCPVYNGFHGLRARKIPGGFLNTHKQPKNRFSLSTEHLDTISTQDFCNEMCFDSPYPAFEAARSPLAVRNGDPEVNTNAFADITQSVPEVAGSPRTVAGYRGDIPEIRITDWDEEQRALANPEQIQVPDLGREELPLAAPPMTQPTNAHAGRTTIAQKLADTIAAAEAAKLQARLDAALAPGFEITQLSVATPPITNTTNLPALAETAIPKRMITHIGGSLRPAPTPWEKVTSGVSGLIGGKAAANVPRWKRESRVLRTRSNLKPSFRVHYPPGTPWNPLTPPTILDVLNTDRELQAFAKFDHAIHNFRDRHEYSDIVLSVQEGREYLFSQGFKNFERTTGALVLAKGDVDAVERDFMGRRAQYPAIQRQLFKMGFANVQQIRSAIERAGGDASLAVNLLRAEVAQMETSSGGNGKHCVAGELMGEKELTM